MKQNIVEKLEWSFRPNYRQCWNCPKITGGVGVGLDTDGHEDRCLFQPATLTVNAKSPSENVIFNSPSPKNCRTFLRSLFSKLAFPPQTF